MNEAIAQFLFWISMGCLPSGLIGLAYGIHNRREKKGKFFVLWSAVVLAHFVWYFRTLGLALADKTGGLEYPKWWLHILIGLIAGVLVATLTRGRNRAEPARRGQPM